MVASRYKRDFGIRRTVTDRFEKAIRSFEVRMLINAYNSTQPSDDRRTVLKAQAANEQRNRTTNDEYT